MRPKQVNALLAVTAFLLFSFSCFCISRMSQTSNQLFSCRSHMLEFKENMLRLKNKTDENRQELMKALDKMKNEITERENQSRSLVEKKVDTLGTDETEYNTFEELKLFFPHLRKAGRVYPDVIIGKGKTGVSFALGIPTMNRGNYSYLKQTLTSVVSRMTLSEEKDSVVIVAIADSNEDYINYVVNMIKKNSLQAWCLSPPSWLKVMLHSWELNSSKFLCNKVGKLFRSEDLTDLVRFFLLFYKERPIDILLDAILHVKTCGINDTLKNCTQKKQQVRIQYQPSLFQHVGVHSSFLGKEQYFKKNKYEDKYNMKKFLYTLEPQINFLMASFRYYSDVNA